jgi:hypothetical protein
MQSVYKVQNGETLQDVCIKLYGSLEYQTKLMSDNGINLYDDITGESLVYDPTIILTLPKAIQSNTTKDTTQLSVVGIDRQSVFDIAIQSHGSLENIVSLLNSNGLTFSDMNNVKQKEFIYYTTDVKNYPLYNFMQNLGTSAGSVITKIVAGGSFNNAFDLSFDGSNGKTGVAYNKSFNKAFK